MGGVRGRNGKGKMIQLYFSLKYIKNKRDQCCMVLFILRLDTTNCIENSCVYDKINEGNTENSGE